MSMASTQSEKDVARRAAAYNRAFFKDLHCACLQRFSRDQHLRVLEHSESRIAFIPQHRHEAAKKAIRLDWEWVHLTECGL